MGRTNFGNCLGDASSLLLESERWSLLLPRLALFCAPRMERSPSCLSRDYETEPFARLELLPAGSRETFLLPRKCRSVLTMPFLYEVLAIVMDACRL